MVQSQRGMMKNIPRPSNQPACDRPDYLERRKSSSSRRKIEDRRSEEERRFDSRVARVSVRKKINAWIRSLIHSRLGVDRRKKRDQRRNVDRRQQRLESILTQNEIADLLS
jgi:hypothetical protein